MRSRERVYLVIIIVLVVLQALSFAEISSLERQNNELRSRVDALTRITNSNITLLQGLSYNYSLLKSKYSSLQSKYSELRKKYYNVLDQYSVLQRDYRVKERAEQKALNLLSVLSRRITVLYNESISYTRVPYAFKRVLNYYEIYLIRDKVFQAVKHRDSLWLAIQDIYDWIVANIQYVHDTPHLMVSINYTVLDGKLVVTDLRYEWVRNYIQAPRETIELRQGDCDDMAVLAYAMIKYYMVGIQLHDQPLYIAKIIMNSGYAHMAVFLPVGNGSLTIIDPAGHYLTVYISLMDARPALEELMTYSNYWGNYGGISRIYLYEINVADGSYRLAAFGDVYMVADYLEHNA